MKLSCLLSQIFLTLSFLISTSVSAQKVLIDPQKTLTIMKEQITNLHDNYFDLKKSDINKRYKTIVRNYLKLYVKSQRWINLKAGILILDLDETLLRMKDPFSYFSSREAELPKNEIRKVLRASLDQGMTLLFISSGLHTELVTIRDHICREFNISKEEFSIQTDIIVGCKTFKSHFKKAIDYEEEAEKLNNLSQFNSLFFKKLQLSQELRNTIHNLKQKAQDSYDSSINKGKVWLQWIAPLVSRDKNLIDECKESKPLKIPVIVVDDWEINLLNIKNQHSGSLWRFDLDFFAAFTVDPNNFPDERSDIQKRAYAWQEIYTYLTQNIILKKSLATPLPSWRNILEGNASGE